MTSGDSPRIPGAGIAVVIPLQDEERTIEALLTSLATQTLPPDKIILVDAGSRDQTVAKAVAMPVTLPIQVVPAGRVYPGVARNAGVAAAGHDWIAFTDGGVVLDREWLAELVRCVATGIGVVFGSLEPVCDTFFRQCAAIAYVPARDQTGTRGPWVASCIISRPAFLRAGGFPAFRAAEDLIFISRLLETGARPAFAPKAIAYWEIAGGVVATFRRFESYSYHNLIARWGRRWHMGTARLYAAFAVVVAGAALHGEAAWAVAIAPAFFTARAVKSAYLKRASFEFPTLAPQRVLGTAAILLILDMATFTGFVRWAVDRARRRV